MAVTARALLSNFNDTMAWRVTSTPTEAMTLASAGAARSGRNTSRCTSSPSSAAKATPRTKHTMNGGEPMLHRSLIPNTGKTTSPVLRNSSYT